jgi:hypothetical protein
MNRLTPVILLAMISAQRSASSAVSSGGGISAGGEKGSDGQECIGRTPRRSSGLESVELNGVKGYDGKWQGRSSHAGFVEA